MFRSVPGTGPVLPNGGRGHLLGQGVPGKTILVPRAPLPRCRGFISNLQVP